MQQPGLIRLFFQFTYCSPSGMASKVQRCPVRRSRCMYLQYSYQLNKQIPEQRNNQTSQNSATSYCELQSSLQLPSVSFQPNRSFKIPRGYKNRTCTPLYNSSHFVSLTGRNSKSKLPAQILPLFPSVTKENHASKTSSR